MAATNAATISNAIRIGGTRSTWPGAGAQAVIGTRSAMRVKPAPARTRTDDMFPSRLVKFNVSKRILIPRPPHLHERQEPPQGLQHPRAAFLAPLALGALARLLHLPQVLPL